MQFIIDNQAWFLLLACFVLLAVIGKAADMRRNKAKEEKRKEIEDEIEKEVSSEEQTEENSIEEDYIEVEEVVGTELAEEPTDFTVEIEESVPEQEELVEEPAQAEDTVVSIEEAGPLFGEESNLNLEVPVVTESGEDLSVPLTEEPKMSFDFNIPTPTPEPTASSISEDDFGINEIPALMTAQPTKEEQDDDGIWEFK